MACVLWLGVVCLVVLCRASCVSYLVPLLQAKSILDLSSADSEYLRLIETQELDAHSSAHRDKLRRQAAHARNTLSHLQGVIQRHEQLVSAHDRSGGDGGGGHRRRGRRPASVSATAAMPTSALFLRGVREVWLRESNYTREGMVVAHQDLGSSKHWSLIVVP